MNLLYGQLMLFEFPIKGGIYKVMIMIMTNLVKITQIVYIKFL